jgi:hypothetical protein
MSMPAGCYVFELNHARAIMAYAIFCRQGGGSSTSTAEVFFESAAGARRLLFIKWCVPVEEKATSGFDSSSEMELSSILLRFLGGDALRTPTICGGGTQGSDFFFSFCPRVFSIIREGPSSNFRFLRARDVRGPLCKFYLPCMDE